MLKIYIHEGRVDTKQAVPFVAICSATMIYRIKMFSQNIVSVVYSIAECEIGMLERYIHEGRQWHVLQYALLSL